MLQYQGAPEVEIDKFNGNPLEYQYFVSMFNQLVEKRVNDQTGRLTRLLKFTDGEAKELIKHCIYFPPETGYETAMRLLNNRYGNPHYLLASYRKEIKALPSVKPGDGSGSRKFYSFVLKRDTFSKSTAWNALKTPETLCILVSKLPGSLRETEVSVDDNQEVSLFIGVNCVHALEPRDVISSQNGGPYAFKTLLGCCVVGPMINQTKAGKFG